MALYKPTFTASQITAPDLSKANVGAFAQAFVDMGREAEEKRRYEDQLERQRMMDERQRVADERAATEFGWKQKEHEQGVANREFVKNYDPRIGIGGRGVEEATQRAMAGEGGDIVQQILSRRGIQTTPQGKGVGLTSYLDSASGEDRAKLQAELANVGSRGLSRLQSMATQEPVRDAVLQDIVRQTGDVAQARVLADQFAAGTPTTRESILAQEKARMDAINTQRKALLDREKIAMDMDQKAFDNAIKYAKTVDKDLGKRGTAGTGISGPLDRYDLAQQVDKLLPRGWFGNQIDNPAAFEAGSKVIGKVPQDGKPITSAEVIAAMKQSYDRGRWDTTVVKNEEELARLVLENRARGTAPSGMEDIVQRAYSGLIDPEVPGTAGTKRRMMELTGDLSGRGLEELLQERGRGAFQGMRVGGTSEPRSGTPPTPQVRGSTAPRTSLDTTIRADGLSNEQRASQAAGEVLGLNLASEYAEGNRVPAEVVQNNAAIQAQIEELRGVLGQEGLTAEQRGNVESTIKTLEQGMKDNLQPRSGVGMNPKDYGRVSQQDFNEIASISDPVQRAEEARKLLIKNYGSGIYVDGSQRDWDDFVSNRGIKGALDFTGNAKEDLDKLPRAVRTLVQMSNYETQGQRRDRELGTAATVGTAAIPGIGLVGNIGRAGVGAAITARATEKIAPIVSKLNTTVKGTLDKRSADAVKRRIEELEKLKVRNEIESEELALMKNLLNNPTAYGISAKSRTGRVVTPD